MKGHRTGNTRQLRLRRWLAPTALLGTATYVLAGLLFAVSDAVARGGSGSHSFSGGGGGGGGSGSAGHLHSQFFNNGTGTTSGSGGVVVGIVIGVVVILIVGFSLYFSRRARRTKPA